MWKNKHEAVSAKKKKKKQNSASQRIQQDDELRMWCIPEELVDDKKYSRNDRISWDGGTYTCRKTHWASESDKTPDKDVKYWREDAIIQNKGRSRSRSRSQSAESLQQDLSDVAIP